ncbi:MAG: amidase [Spirochaetaceae bacterium]|nr:amidase [Myxococcales bacterium]MCB9725739.1 amidase [Spirochaetaceae bacterium]HPG27842.1 amidase [Myxococcota bacterium]
MLDYENEDALGLAARVKRGETTAEALLEAALARVDARDGELGALVVRAEDVARRAIAEGLPRGPFEGVPFLLKDLHLGWPGVRLTNGSSLFARHVSHFESELVARYRRAGLVLFGRTHSPEFGLTTTTESRLHGATRNPWDPSRTAGGSSGGAAVAVAAGYTPIANAGDGGGSIRIPASCCGLFGLKPTRGRTPAGPDAGEGWSGMTTLHAITRSVRDSAALLDATSGPDPGAPYAAQPPARPFLDEVGAPPGRLRIALQRRTWNGVETHPDCEEAVEAAAALCRSLGHEVEEAPFTVDAAAMREATLVIMSVSTRLALDARAAALGRTLAPEDVEPATRAILGYGAKRGAVDHARAVQTLHATGRALARHLMDFDLVLSPTMATPPLPIGRLSLSNPDVEEQGRSVLATIGFTQLANVAGNPAMSVPLVWSASGLPIGVQFVGRMDDEATLFRLAGQLEQARPWGARRPVLAPAAPGGGRDPARLRSPS